MRPNLIKRRFLGPIVSQYSLQPIQALLQCRHLHKLFLVHLEHVRAPPLTQVLQLVWVELVIGEA